ncbi:MAG: polymer-forming cytoskeletal protein [Myxococcota bacterium]
MKRASVIPQGVRLVGDIEGDTDLVVLGRVEGPIHVTGTLIIEETGLVRGHVRGRTVTVRGVLKGNAFGEEAVRVGERARLVGELTAPRVHVAVGAQFRGQVHVGEVQEPRLGIYDPALHTFTGAPAPTMEASLDAGSPPQVRATVPVPPPVVEATEETPVESAMARATVPVPPPEAAAMARATVPVPPPAAMETSEPATAVEPEDDAPLVMPALGRVRARRRS